VLMNYTESGNPLETIIARLMVEIARGESLVRQRSMILSVYDNRDSLCRRRRRLEEDSATYIAGLHNLARDHGLDPLRHIRGEDLDLVRLAASPLSEKEGRS
jgi:hypothetical protein